MSSPGALVAQWAGRFLADSPVGRRILDKSLAVFLYHEVSRAPSEFNRLFNLSVHPDRFSRHLDFIRSRFRIISPEELLKGNTPRPAALITFDDGNLSYFREALPILKAKGIPSVVFLNMEPIRGEVCWSGLVTYLQHHESGFVLRDGRRPSGNDFCRLGEAEVAHYLEGSDASALLQRVRAFRGKIASEADLRATANDPLVTLGNHLFNHYNATLLSDRLKEEYWKNQQLLEDYPNGRRLVSYPFGCWNPATSRMLLEEGAQALFAGGGLPNFGTRGLLFHRVELGDRVTTEAQMHRALFRNLLPAIVRRKISWS
jgi:peptidoglycan/xylan/chitin deacetylase (PgdA/CDA1 family)